MDIDLNPQSPVIKRPCAVIGHSYSCGIFWKREKVDWRLPRKLLGRQPWGTISINLAQQHGQYRLFMGKKLVHLGVTAPDDLGECLYQCTINEFAHKWDHFSWLGLCPVNRDGTIGLPSKEMPRNHIFPLTVTWLAYHHEGLDCSMFDNGDAKPVRQVPTA